MMSTQLKTQIIKQLAKELGFDACGICQASYAQDHAQYLKEWLHTGKHASMHFMSNHLDKRLDPSLLMENARSVVVVALNYYPEVKLPEDHPQFSYYAYGTDYHDIIKERLRKLLALINAEMGLVNGRVFCDSAPVLEKYHAWKAGIGWIGKHTQLIIPGKGSYFFLGILLLDIELEVDEPLENRCGDCTKCLDACPTKALESPYSLNAGKCLSYLTIEHKGEIPPVYASRMENCVYGCDRCNQACPWNKCAQPTHVAKFHPSDELLNLDKSALNDLTETDFNRIFKHSAVKRAGYQGLMRNVSSARDAVDFHDR